MDSTRYIGYVFTIICMDLVTVAYRNNKTMNMAIKLHEKFIYPLLKKFNLYITDYHTVYDNLKNFYYNASQNDCLKIRNYLNKNMDTYEIACAELHNFYEKSKTYYCLCKYACNCNSIGCKCFYRKYCCTYKYTLYQVIEVHYALEYLKYNHFVKSKTIYMHHSTPFC